MSTVSLANFCEKNNKITWKCWPNLWVTRPCAWNAATIETHLCACACMRLTLAAAQVTTTAVRSPKHVLHMNLWLPSAVQYATYMRLEEFVLMHMCVCVCELVAYTWVPWENQHAAYCNEAIHRRESLCATHTHTQSHANRVHIKWHAYVWLLYVAKS